MSSVAQDELNNLTNEQLRLRCLKHGLSNIPVTDSTRGVLLKKLRRTINGQSDGRRDTIHVTNYSVEQSEENNDSKPASKKTANRRITVSAISATTNDVAPVVKPKSARRSGRITPTVNENGIAASIAVPPSESDIIEVDEQPAPEVYIQPKRDNVNRTSRSPSLGKSQTVVTSYKTEIAKPITILESDEEEDDEDDNEYDDDDNEDTIPVTQNRIYPSLPKTNEFSNTYASSTKDSSYLSSTKDMASNLGRTITHNITYEPSAYKSTLHDPKNYDVPTTFKAPLSKPRPSTSYSNYDNTSGLNRRYTTNTYASNRLVQNYEDESGTEHSDFDAPYLSDFTRRLSQLKAEPINRKIIRGVKQQHLQADDSLWHSFTTLVIAFGRKFGSILLAFIILMIVVFVYVFFIMG